MADRQARDLTGENAEWARRPWARTFALIQGRYGWATDDALLDLTPARVRQMRSVILAEKREEHTREMRIHERVTRELVLHVRQAAGDKKAEKAANGVKFVHERVAGRPGPRELPSTEAVMRRFGPAPPPRGE